MCLHVCLSGQLLRKKQLVKGLSRHSNESNLFQIDVIHQFASYPAYTLCKDNKSSGISIFVCFLVCLFGQLLGKKQLVKEFFQAL